MMELLEVTLGLSVSAASVVYNCLLVLLEWRYVVPVQLVAADCWSVKLLLY